MKIAILFLGLMMIILAGCTTPGKSVEGGEYTPSESTLTCGDLCSALPTEACVGNWIVAGVYPDCNCTFQCNETQTS
ncbi:hypothetical protein KKF81_05310 [Candidatus Micrarchaeota archaeon]|nr:hypothetical protein [Candidatus Micrarchaeota archaeon]MBU1166345.1 hypothetical protein [Candidatus Micrarchaeota archaeon]MBU1886403.1 hypothetical protein [Candidatus Micrarchaeota archaeon]